MTGPRQLLGRLVFRVRQERRFARVAKSGVMANARLHALAVQRAADATAPPPVTATEVGRATSRLCTYADLRDPTYESWCRELELPPVAHRKQWEYAFIAGSLESCGLLVEGRRGLGFGVGREPLTALFASRGVEVVATDQPRGTASARSWSRSDEFADGKAALARVAICDQSTFDTKVRFRHVDMNDVPSDLVGFDFVWSKCAFEHLGSIEAGMRFVERSIDCLRPGGVAVHTTEFNLTSNTETVEHPHCVVYRRRDIEMLANRLRSRGCWIELDFDSGNAPLDAFVDLPPYGAEPHLRLMLEQYACTSIGLVIRRPD